MQIGISSKPCIGRSKLCKGGAKISMAPSYGASSFNPLTTEFRSYLTENTTSPL
jgi:hypothetical protein